MDGVSINVRSCVAVKIRRGGLEDGAVAAAADKIVQMDGSCWIGRGCLNSCGRSSIKDVLSTH